MLLQLPYFGQTTVYATPLWQLLKTLISTPCPVTPVSKTRTTHASTTGLKVTTELILNVLNLSCFHHC